MKLSHEIFSYSSDQLIRLIEQLNNEGQLHEFMQLIISTESPLEEEFCEACLSLIKLPRLQKNRNVLSLIPQYCAVLVLPQCAGSFFTNIMLCVNRHTTDSFAEATQQVLFKNSSLLKQLGESLLLVKNIVLQQFAFSQLLQNQEIVSATTPVNTTIFGHIQSFITLFLILDRLVGGVANSILQMFIQILTRLDTLQAVLKGAEIEKIQMQQVGSVEDDQSQSMKGSVALSMRAMGSFRLKAQQLNIQNIQQQNDLNEVDYNILSTQITATSGLSAYLQELLATTTDTLFCGIIQFLQQKNESFLVQSFIPLYSQLILPNKQLKYSYFLAFPLLQVGCFQEEFLKQLFVTAFGNANVNFHAAVSATSYLEGLIARSASIAPDFLNQVISVVLQYVNAMDQEIDLESEIQKAAGRQLKCEYLNPGIQRYLLGARCISYIFCFQWQCFDFNIVGEQFVQFLQNANQPFRCFNVIAQQVCTKLEAIGVDDSIVADQIQQHDLVLLPQVYPFEPILLEGASRYIDPFYRVYDQ